MKPLILLFLLAASKLAYNRAVRQADGARVR